MVIRKHGPRLYIEPSVRGALALSRRRLEQSLEPHVSLCISRRKTFRRLRAQQTEQQPERGMSEELHQTSAVQVLAQSAIVCSEVSAIDVAAPRRVQRAARSALEEHKAERPHIAGCSVIHIALTCLRRVMSPQRRSFVAAGVERFGRIERRVEYLRQTEVDELCLDITHDLHRAFIANELEVGFIDHHIVHLDIQVTACVRAHVIFKKLDLTLP